MVDITLNTELTTDWKHISAEMPLADGSTYLMDISFNAPLNVANDVYVHWAFTSDTTEPTAALSPHIWRAQLNGLSAQARFAQRAGQELWMRMATGTAILVATPV